MKKLKYITLPLLTAGILLLSPGCEKILDIDPTGRLPKEDVFGSADNVKAILNSVYTVVGSGSWNSGRVQQFNELLGDQYFGGQLGTTKGEIFNRQSSRFNADLGGFFNEPYIAIQRCNQVLENSGSLGADFKDNAEGQAKFVRAFAHFDLVKLFAQPYGFTADNSHPGISLRVKTDILIGERATVKAVYDQIIADLKDAEVKLPVANGVYPTKWAAKALLARVYFQMNKFQEAYTYSNDVITNGKNTKGQNLALDADFTGRFSVAGSNEAIWEIANEADANIAARSNSYRDLFLSTGNPEMKLATSFFTSATNNTNDQRKVWYTAGPSAEFALLKKFDVLRFKINVLHLTEMKLIRAEAGAELGGASLTVAIQDVNDLRNKAYNNTIPVLDAASSASLVKDIARAERLLEMVGEGDRVQQLKRIGAKGESSIIRGSIWSCPGMILQLPSGEVDNSPGMKYNPEGGC